MMGNQFYDARICPSHSGKYQFLRKIPASGGVRRARFSAAATALLSAAALGVAATPAAHAGTTIVVTTTADETVNDGNCSLEEAIQAVSTQRPVDACPAGSGGDQIVLAAGARYTLNSINNNSEGANGLPVVAEGLTIDGKGATITRSSAAPQFRMTVVQPGGGLTLKDLTVSNFDSPVSNGTPGIGGAVLAHGNLVVMRSTISGNRAEGPGGRVDARGGAIWAEGALIVTNSTITGNTAVGTGGSVGGGIIIRPGSTARITSSTFSGNSGNNGADIESETTALTITNTIMASGCLLEGPLTDGGHNLDTGTSCHFTAGTDLQRTNPQLGALADNGGPTPTEAPAPSSPAIGAGGDPCPAADFGIDQRGVRRGHPCDIGAVEDPTSYLDKIEAALKNVSPGLEHQVWERTHGNKLDNSAGDWLLQTPQCWGTNPCPLNQRPGTIRLLNKITSNIAAATNSVDMTTLGCPVLPGAGCDPMPDGAFKTAIASGLRQAAGNHRIMVRILSGAALFERATGVDGWLSGLKKQIGPNAANITFQLGVMTTSTAGKRPFKSYTPSWNHSKLIAVDGRTVITGGVNAFNEQYVNTPAPVTDAVMAVRGPAAASATFFINRLWGWACTHITYSIFADEGASVYPKGSCVATITPLAPEKAGHLDMLEVGGLGVGIQSKDPTSTFQLPPVRQVQDAKCDIHGADADLVNGPAPYAAQARDYYTVNPEETALQAMIATARQSITFSQQDLYGGCLYLFGPVASKQPLGDLRMMDTLATKMIQDVKVRIVISTPGAPDYSDMSKMSQLSDLLRKRIALQTGSLASAEQVMDRTLQYASLRSSNQATWKGGKCDKQTCLYALHTKLIVVDGKVFYIGSKNAYPAFLQDDGYYVEDPAAVAHITSEFLDPEWRYSKADAVYDWQTHKHPRFP
jgi:CSLREA domain-containing protein